MEFEPRLLPAGDQAILIEFGAEINPTMNRLVHACTQKAKKNMIPGIRELIPAYCTILVYYDPFILSFSDTISWIREMISRGVSVPESPATVKEVPVVYGGEYGPDISFVAEHNRISVPEVIRYHTKGNYLVYLLSFSPGFAAMGIVPKEIQAPRLPSPRIKVPAGSVGIGGLQTGVYPVESPGGWRLIGRSPLRLFDLDKNPPTYLQAGDYVHFYPISEEEFRAWGEGN